MAHRTIVITGASDGIGAAAARRLSRSGDNVVVVGRSEGKTKAVAADLGADYFVADFADLSQVRALADKTAFPVPAHRCVGQQRRRHVLHNAQDGRRSRDHVSSQLPGAISAHHTADRPADRLSCHRRQHIELVAETTAQCHPHRLRNYRPATAERRLRALQAGKHPVHPGTASAPSRRRPFGRGGPPGFVDTNIGDASGSRLLRSCAAHRCGDSSRPQTRAPTSWSGWRRAHPASIGRRGSTTPRAKSRKPTAPPMSPTWPASCGNARWRRSVRAAGRPRERDGRARGVQWLHPRGTKVPKMGGTRP